MPGSPLNAAASIGVELEKVRDAVYPQFQQDDTFLSMIQVRTDNLDVSDRLCRIPILVQPGSQFSQFTPDGSSMGVGSGEKYDDGVTTPVYFNQAVQITKEAEWATNSKEKSVVDVFKDSFKLNLRQFRSNIEALMSSSDGSGTLGTVTSTATAGQLTVSNSNNFQASCVYQVWSALGGTYRGNISALTVDSVNNILYLVGTFPPGTTNGDLLLVNGASGVANTSLNGIPAINVSSSTGQWFGINRSAYPGVLNTPYLNASSGPLTPQIVQILESYMQRATGVDTEDLDDCFAHANVDQVSAWELLGLVTTSAGGFSSGSGQTSFVSQEGSGKGGDTRMDYMKGKRIKTLAGRKLVTNIHAQRARLDLICAKYWFRVESKPASLFDVDGITVFPLYGNDGGVATSQAFYFVCGMQMATSRARSGAYTDTLAVPTGF
jgi:hypothetical protein